MGNGGRGIAKAPISNQSQQREARSSSPAKSAKDFEDFAFKDNPSINESRGATAGFLMAQAKASKRKASDLVILTDSDSDSGWIKADVSPDQVARNQAVAIAARKSRIINRKDTSKAQKKVPTASIPKRQRVIDSDDDESASGEEIDDDEKSFDTAGEDIDDDEIVDTPVVQKVRPRILDKSGFPVYDAAAFETSPEVSVGGVELVRKNRLKNERESRATGRAISRTKLARRIVTSPTSSADEHDNDDDDNSAFQQDKSSAETGTDDSSDSESAEFGAMDEEATQGDIKTGARIVLQKCKALSETLRDAIRRWEASATKVHKSSFSSSKSSRARDGASTSTVIDVDADEGGQTTEVTEVDREGRGCLHLTSMDTNTSTVLSAADFPFLSAQGLALKLYQVVGVNWMRLLHETQVNGVLADDMGLGKTVQAAAFLGWLQHRARQAGHASLLPHLIVVPASTLSNWQKELARCCPNLRVLTYHGSQSERYQLRQQWRQAEAAFERRGGEHACDVLLSTYTIFEREAGGDDRSFLNKQHFSYLVLDEAHCIKNPASSRYENLSRLRSKHRLLLSGTPVQNNISELLALLSFLMPKVFKRSSCDLLLASFNLKKGTSNDASLLLLRKMLVPFVLRRLKSDVMDQLVAKEIFVQTLPMVPSQAVVYDSIIAAYLARKQRMQAKAQSDKRDELAWSLDKPSAKNKKFLADPPATARVMVDLTDEGTSKGPQPTNMPAVALDLDQEILTVDPTLAAQLQVTNVEHEVDLSAREARHLFTALRKAANHPLLLRVHYRDEAQLDTIVKAAMAADHFGSYCTTAQAKQEILTNFNDFDVHQICLEYGQYGGVDRFCLPEEALFDSPKFQWLRDNLPRMIQEGHHVLVFSQWTRILDLLELLMSTLSCAAPTDSSSTRTASSGIPFLRLDGSTPVTERQALIDRFNSGAIPVFLLSTKAGGLGINLTTADTVIMHDLDFNPENDRQAEDRAHRIGQLRAVRVYKLIAAGTVDEDIHAMGERKRELSRAVLSSQQGPGSTSKKDGANDDDINTIGKILQVALNRRTNK